MNSIHPATRADDPRAVRGETGRHDDASERRRRSAFRPGAQRGFFQLATLAALPWATIAKVAAAVALAFVIYQTLDNNWETDAGIAKGKADTVELYRKRDNDARDKFEADKRALEAKNRKLEADLSAANKGAGERYQKGLDDGKKELADARGRVAARGGLRDPGARSSAVAACPTVSASGSNRPGLNGAPRAELPATDRGVFLSPEATEFVLGRASEADEAVKQLNGVQDGLEACYAAMEKAAGR